MSKKIEQINESVAAPIKHDKDTYKIILIKSGPGSKAYYPEDVLRADGPIAFPAGTHSYIGHPTDANGNVIPNGERDPDKAIGVFTESAHYEDGVGLVSYLKPFAHVKAKFAELAPHMGMSIHASAKFVNEYINGVTRKVVKHLVPAITNTVDLVSYAGAGGQVVMESLLSGDTQAPHDTVDENHKEGKGHMATLEDKVDNLITVVESLISEVTTAKQALEDEKTVVAESASNKDEAVAAALVAQKSVLEAEGLTKTFTESLLAGIESGDYDVESKITSFKAVRDEILNESKSNDEGQNGHVIESLGYTANGASTANHAIAKWGTK